MAKSRLAFPFSFILPSSRPPQRISRYVDSYLIRYPGYCSRLQHGIQGRRSFGITVISHKPADTTGQRYGTANEPPPHLSDTKMPPKPPAQKSAEESDKAVAADAKQASASALPVAETALAQKVSSTQSETQETEQSTPKTQDEETSTIMDIPYMGQPPSKDSSSTDSPQQPALETILSWESPMSDKEEKPPHLEPPPYMHHFDTYTLVRNLEDGGFTEGEAVILMKSVRAILADNMDLARDGLVSKGDAEMTAYLFRAACSELRTEIRHNRGATAEHMQSERNSLQHGVDVLSQRITAESGSLKDELKGMFDDRKMAVRIDRRDVENRIQEVNYRITTELNSEMKSEIEGLRWVLVRRTAISIGIVTLTALLLLKIMGTAEKRREELEAAQAASATAFASPDGSNKTAS